MKNTYLICGRILFWISWPALFVYLFVGKRTRVLIIAEGEVLLAKTWYGSGKWNVLGGGIKYNESSQRGAIREVLEETGVILEPKQLIELTTKAVIVESGLRIHCIGYVAELSQKPKVKRQKMEISDLAWFPLTDIASRNIASPSVRELIQLWKSIR